MIQGYASIYLEKRKLKVFCDPKNPKKIQIQQEVCIWKQILKLQKDGNHNLKKISHFVQSVKKNISFK